MRAVLVAVLLAVSTASALAQPRVIASVVPVYGIVSAVMGETGQPELLLEGRLSEHRAKFSPRQIASLGEADLVFIIGQGLEGKLSQLSGTDAVNGKTFVELALAPGVTTLPVREGGAWSGHAHDHAHDHGDQEAEGVLTFDPHVWLDPENARAMAAAVARALSDADPANAPAYASNAAAFAQSLETTVAAIATELRPVKDQPYVVFHDAFQYFEHRFGLNPAGAIADISAQAPSAGRIAELRHQIEDVKAVCVFREPQYDDRLVTTVTEGTAARAGVLDPIGAGLTPGPQSYQTLLVNLASGFRDCLAD
jgi:zinc transport system substrate-binding protein